MSRKRILIIDDHPMFRAGLRMLLAEGLPEAEVIEAGTTSEALQGGMPAPELVLLDIKLPGLNGIDGITLLNRQWPATPIAMLSSLDDPETVREALARGAAAFISKGETAERMVETVARILAQGIHALAQREAPAAAAALFTPRQCEVLELLCEGLPNKLIARRLDLSENTVRWHVQAILGALGVASRSEAAFAARRLGLVG